MQCACKNACLFIYLFGALKGRFNTQVLLHITQNQFFPYFSIISAISWTFRHVEMAGHPWATKILIDIYSFP